MKLKDNIIIETSVKRYTIKGEETERGTEYIWNDGSQWNYKKCS